MALITAEIPLVLIFSTFFALILSMNILPAYASTSSSPSPTGTSTEQPEPGTLIVITFENGTSKAIRSHSTSIQAVNGGYFIADSSVKQSQPLQSKAVSKTVIQQLVSIFVDVNIDKPPTSSEGCGQGYGFYVDDPNPVCEPLDKIGKGPPSDMAFCAALGCPYNPPADSEPPGESNNLVTTPVTPTETPASEPQPPSEPEPDPGDGDQNEEEENENENQNEDSDSGSDGSGDSGSDGSGDGGSDESEE